MKILKRTLSIIGWVVVGILLLITTVNVIDKATKYNCSFFGIRTSTIVSESMQTVHPNNTYIDPSWNRINKNDVVISKDYASYNDIQQYDVIVYYMESKNILVCHRVIDLYEVNGVKYIETRGDANNTNDAPITYAEVKGKVVSVIGGLGIVVSFVSSPYFLLALCASIFFIAIGYILYQVLSKKNKKEKGNNTKV